MPSIRSSTRATVVLLLLVSPGCVKPPSWQSPPAVRAPDSDVAEALGDRQRDEATAVEPGELPSPPVPAKLRPCCAFGTELRVRVGDLPVPGLVVDNMRGLDDLGPHRYNSGVLAVDASSERALIEVEHNGQVYTCRGGFIDTAHVRDNADITLFLNAQIARHLDTGGSITLPPQGGSIQLRLEPISTNTISSIGRRPLTRALAQWATFQLSIWHEIASWYGYAAIAGFPEKVSAFSPEDLYSNLLGTKIAGGIIDHGHAADEREYNRTMDAWLLQALRRLQIVSRPQAKLAMRSLDGRWWDSSKALPDWQVVIRRNTRVTTRIRPWLVPAAFAGNGPNIGCDGAGPALPLRNPHGLEGLRFSTVATLEVTVDDALVAEGFPLRATGERRVVQKEFPRIIRQIRREMQATLGPHALHPTSAASAR